MPQVTTNLNQEEYDRLMNLIPGTGETIYAFVKEAIEMRIRELTSGKPAQPPLIVLEMVAALRERKWSLYQMQDYSDHNHKMWLQGRFRTATKSEILDAIALFRTKVSE